MKREFHMKIRQFPDQRSIAIYFNILDQTTTKMEFNTMKIVLTESVRRFEWNKNCADHRDDDT